MAFSGLGLITANHCHQPLRLAPPSRTRLSAALRAAWSHRNHRGNPPCAGLLQLDLGEAASAIPALAVATVESTRVWRSSPDSHNRPTTRGSLTMIDSPKIERSSLGSPSATSASVLRCTDSPRAPLATCKQPPPRSSSSANTGQQTPVLFSSGRAHKSNASGCYRPPPGMPPPPTCALPRPPPATIGRRPSPPPVPAEIPPNGDPGNGKGGLF